MAVTAIWPIKGRLDKVINYARNPEKTTEVSSEMQSALHVVNDVVEYAADDMKTERRSYVSCLNCREETAAAQFTETKQLWGKIGGRVCYHGYQSFKADEVTAEIAHEIGLKLAQELWGDRFEVLVATHCNTGHYHNHFVINSVSFADGYKFYNSPADYALMRKVSDRLCREYKISVIENPEGKAKQYSEWRAENQGQTTQRGTIRADIDREISDSLTRDDFFDGLKEMGYELKLYDKKGDWLEYPALKPPGAKGFFRFHKLGPGYDMDEITRRIQKNLVRNEPFPEAEEEQVQQYRREHIPPQFDWKKPRLYKLYLRYCYELHIIEQHPASQRRVSFFMREDLARLERLDLQTRFLTKNQFSTAEELITHKERAQLQIDALYSQRSQLRNEVKRLERRGDATGAEKAKEQISDIIRQIRAIKKEVVLCDAILSRSSQTEEELDQLLNEQEKKPREEEMSDELLRGRSGTGRENDARRR